MTIYTWANGVLSDYWMTYELPEPGLGSMSFLLTGSEAMLRLDVYGKVEVSRPDGGWETGRSSRHPFDPLNAVDPQAPARLRGADGGSRGRHRTSGRDPFVSGREGLNTTQMLEGADRSAKLNQAVELPL